MDTEREKAGASGPGDDCEDGSALPSKAALAVVTQIRYAQALNIFCWLFMIPARPEMILRAMKGIIALHLCIYRGTATCALPTDCGVIFLREIQNLLKQPT